jgi:hypothetical protein
MSEWTRHARWEALIFLCIAVLLSAGGCKGEHSGVLYLADFESDAELDTLHWRCKTLFSLSDEHATHGRKALKMELYPSDYPGLSFVPQVKDWRGYRELAFDVFVPPDGPGSISVRIDDDKKNTAYGDRFNKRFLLQQGDNRIVIPLADLKASDGRRALEVSHIERVLIFAVSPPKKNVVYLDAVQVK